MLSNCFVEIGDNAFGVGVYVGREVARKTGGYRYS